MARARMPASGYRPPALDLTDDPFRELDAAGLEQLIKSIAVDDERFAGIRAEIGNIVELWRIERQLELEPTRRQLSQSVASIARAARALEEAVGAAQPLEPDGEREHDPLAGHASDNPWALEGLYAAFERVYDPQDAGKDVFNGADEAFAHFARTPPAPGPGCRGSLRRAGMQGGGRRTVANRIGQSPALQASCASL